MPSPTSIEGAKRPRMPSLALTLASATVLALAVLRATVGQSFYDDTFYAVVPWRYAHGARFLVDELSLQTIGSMVAVPFVWLWERVFGLTGIVLAVRLLWVALAAAGAALCARLLRGVASPGAVALAVALPLLAPPYHVFAPTYNTVSSLLLTISALLAFAALRDRREELAVWSGVTLALAAAAYPPLALAAFALPITFAVLARSHRLAIACVVGALLGAAGVWLALFARIPFDQVGQALAFGSANVASFSSPLAKMQWVFGNTARALVSPWLAPMWIAAALASVPKVPPRVRASAMALLPLGAAVPGALLLSQGEQLAFGTSAASWLVTLCAAAVVPSALAARRLGQPVLRRLLVLTGPVSVVGYVTVAYVTNSSWNRAMPAIALAPLAVAVLLSWAMSLREEGGAVVFGVGAILAIATAFTLLFANPFMDSPPSQQLVRVARGPYAGLLTSAPHAEAIEGLRAQAPRWVYPDSRVTFVGQAEAYLLTPGEPFTPASWLYLGKGNSAAIEYFRREGEVPDVVFVSDTDVGFAGGWEKASQADPMLRWVAERYRREGSAGGFGVFVLQR
jgi:hypothetical protein